MFLRFWKRVRHPLFPGVPADPVAWAPKSSRALAGTMTQLRRASALGYSPRDMIFVVVTAAHPLLTIEDRDFLWETFRVPAFRLLCDQTGKVLAYECEAQEGLHLTHEELALEGTTVTSSPCECGRPGARLMNSVSDTLESGACVLAADLSASGS